MWFSFRNNRLAEPLKIGKAWPDLVKIRAPNRGEAYRRLGLRLDISVELVVISYDCEYVCRLSRRPQSPLFKYTKLN